MSSSLVISSFSNMYVNPCLYSSSFLGCADFSFLMFDSDCPKYVAIILYVIFMLFSFKSSLYGTILSLNIVKVPYNILYKQLKDNK